MDPTELDRMDAGVPVMRVVVVTPDRMQRARQRFRDSERGPTLARVGDPWAGILEAKRDLISAMSGGGS